MNHYQTLEYAIGYCFKDKSLLDLALTHCSFGNPHNERLEFLGDAILNLVITKALYKTYPHKTEGDLSYVRASLVNRAALVDVAQILQLGSYIKLGAGEIKNGGPTKSSIMANTLEAIIGAIALDSDEAQCMAVVLCWYQPKLVTLGDMTTIKDAKTQLQEYMQARHLDRPQYHLKAVRGRSHAQTFIVECSIGAMHQPIEATGSSRKAAEQLAAEQWLKQLQVL